MLRRQIDDLNYACPGLKIFTDRCTGATMDRPGWQKLLNLCRRGLVKSIYFCDVSRMSRDKEEGFKTWMDLYDRGIDLFFLQTPHINTDVFRESLKRTQSLSLQSDDSITDILLSGISDALKKYMEALARKDIELAFEQAENERLFLSKRTSEGLQATRIIKGTLLGRPKGLKITTKKAKKCKKFLKKYNRKYGGQLNNTQCAILLDVARSSIVRYLHEMENKK